MPIMPEPPDTPELAPSLGGSRASDIPPPEPDAPPKAGPDAPPEPGEPDGTWRLGFRFNFDFDLGRSFNWHWSSDQRDDTPGAP